MFYALKVKIHVFASEGTILGNFMNKEASISHVGPIYVHLTNCEIHS